MGETASARPVAAVIGSGLGGLAAAVRLQARGYRAVVLERREQPGGRAMQFQRDGFTFDAGPTVITVPHLFEELWALAGRRMADDVELRPVHPFYDVHFPDGTHFEYCGDPEAMRAEVARFCPADVGGYQRFMALSQEICAIGFERLGHVPFLSLGSMLRVLPHMLRLHSFRSVYDLVARHFRDEKLRQVFSFNSLLIGGNPFTTPGLYALIPHVERKWGVHYPVGGVGALVRGLRGLIEGAGGQVRCGAEVAEILLENGRAAGVRLTGGERLPAAIVVSNADTAWTYSQLVPAAARRRWTDRRLQRARYSMGLFLWYFGTRRRWPEVRQHTILLGPRYRGLVDEIFDGDSLPDDFSLYLHRPTATDPGMAPAGGDSFYVLSPVPNLRAPIDWAAVAEPYRQRIAEALERRLLPGLRESVAVSHVVLPTDFRDDLLSTLGAGFGMRPVLGQSAYFRPHNRSEDVPGLFIVGAGTHPGAGVPGVLSTARVLDGIVPHASRLDHE